MNFIEELRKTKACQILNFGKACVHRTREVIELFRKFGLTAEIKVVDYKMYYVIP